MISPPACIVCAGHDVSPFLRIDRVPVLCNQLCDTRSAALSAPAAAISLGFCRACGHIFNLEFDSQLVQYCPEYENSLHYSGKFREYDDALINTLIERYGLRGRTIVEVGCGRGDFLEALCRRGGNRGVGFDPSYSVGQEEAASGCDVVIHREPYAARHADIDADFICSRQTLEHIGEPRTFLEAIRGAACRNGVPVFLEVPNSIYTLRDGGIWDIIYEHCSYFCASSIARVLCESGYRAPNVVETFGGQFLAVDAETDARRAETATAPAPEVARFVGTFAERYRAKVDAWAQRLRAFEQDGRRVVVWGAGSKGTMFLNTLPGTNVEYVVDVNPRKQGNHVTGTGQQIVAPSFLKEYNPDVIICMNPNYAEEIKRQTDHLGLQVTFLVA